MTLLGSNKRGFSLCFLWKLIESPFILKRKLPEISIEMVLEKLHSVFTYLVIVDCGQIQATGKANLTSRKEHEVFIEEVLIETCHKGARIFLHRKEQNCFEHQKKSRRTCYLWQPRFLHFSPTFVCSRLVVTVYSDQGCISQQRLDT